MLRGEVVSFCIEKASAVSGSPIADLPFPETTAVMLLVRGRDLIAPRGKTVLQPGDHVYLFCAPDDRALVNDVRTVRARAAERHDVWHDLGLASSQKRTTTEGPGAQDQALAPRAATWTEAIEPHPVRITTWRAAGWLMSSHPTPRASGRTQAELDTVHVHIYCV
jgi:NhaP-type Na+/H+ and K+/H+ antiporter